MAWHARLSASQTKDWLGCPGTIALAEMFGRHDPSGEAAQLGTCAHALIERCLEEGVAPSAYEGRIIEILKPDTPEEGTSILRKGARWPKNAASRVLFLVDEDMVEATTSFVDYVCGRLVELFPDKYDPAVAMYNENGAFYAFSKDAVDKGILKLEARTNPLPERDDTGGTADVTIDAWPELLEVADYKNGNGVFVPVDDNKQLLSYTLGRAHESGFDHEAYRYTIGQPRHHLAPDDGVTWRETDADGLREFEGELRAGAERVDRARECLANLCSNHDKQGLPTPTLKEARVALYEAGFLSVGDDGSHCTWCPHLTDCPAAKARVQETAQMDFEDEPSDLDVPEGPNHLATVLPWVDFLRTFCKKAEENAEKILHEGREVPGRKLVRKQGNRTLKPDVDEKKLEARMRSHYGVQKPLHADPVPAKLKTGPQLKALVPKAKQAEFEEEFLHRPDGGIIMVDESDKRKAFVPGADAAEDFDDE